VDAAGRYRHAVEAPNFRHDLGRYVAEGGVAYLIGECSSVDSS
jgi:hypothetical protein